jgi:hypothetical protein
MEPARRLRAPLVGMPTEPRAWHQFFMHVQRAEAVSGAAALRVV